MTTIEELGALLQQHIEQDEAHQFAVERHQAQVLGRLDALVAKDVALDKALSDSATGSNVELEAAKRAVLQAHAASEQKFTAETQMLMSEMNNIKGMLREQDKRALSVAEAAEKLPVLIDEMRKERAQGSRWARRLKPVATALATAVVTALSLRFGLPPAAPNSPNTLSAAISGPGPTPTVVATATTGVPK